MCTIIAASRNQHKISEIEAITKKFGMKVISRDEAGLDKREIEEDGRTFEENSFKKADAIMQSVAGLMKSFKMKAYREDTGYGFLRHILIRTGHHTGQIMVVLVTASPIFPSKNNFVKALLKFHPEITTIVANVNDRNTSMVLGEKEQVLYGKGYIEDVLCGRRFRISSRLCRIRTDIKPSPVYSG